MRSVAALAFVALAACAQTASRAVPQTPEADGALSARSTTSAFGYVYDDPSGKPLANVPVHLAPWTGCVRTSRFERECPQDLAVHAFTNGRGKFELRGVPNGHYLLIVGSDDALDFVRATVHDQVWFTGGMQRLKAPTLPSQPRPTAPYPSPKPVAIPAIERSGDYRLASIDSTLEFPCLSAFNHARAKRGLPAFVLDEWLLENVRAIESYVKTAKPGGRRYDIEPIFTGTSSTGGTACSQALVDPAFQTAHSLAVDPRSLWYGGKFLPAGSVGRRGRAHGTQLFGIDPRAKTNPAYPPWP
jgi:hypothetical protein